MKSIVLLIGLALAGVSQALVLDDFSDGNMSNAITSGSFGQNYAATVPGGMRGIYHEVTSNDFGLTHKDVVTNGFYASASKVGVDGLSKINYGLLADLSELNADLSSFNAFCITVLSNDLSADMTMTVTSTASGDVTSLVHNVGLVPSGSPQLVVFNFSEFSGMDFSDVDGIQIKIDGVKDNDIQLDDFKAVPEPASMVVLLGGAALALRRRKNA